MILNLIVRGGGSIVGIVALSLVTLLYSEDVASKYILFTYIVSMASGWATGSYRSKLVSDFIHRREPGSWKAYAFWLVLFGGGVYFVICSFLNVAAGYEGINFNEYLILFFVIICQAFLAVYYAWYWSENRLYMSYFFDSFYMLAVIFSALIGLVFRFDYTVILAVFVVICFCVFLRLNVPSPKLNMQLILASLSSQLVSVISFSDMFFMSGMDSSAVVEYRWLMVAFTLLTVVLQVVRQMAIARKESDLDFTSYLVIFTIALVVLIIQWRLVLPSFSLVALIGIGVVLQMLISFHAVRLYEVGKAGWVTLVNLVILLGVFGLMKLYTVEDASDLLVVKTIIMYLSVLLASGLAVVTKILKVS